MYKRTEQPLYETVMEPSEDVVRIECIKIQIDNLHGYSFLDLTPHLDVLEVDPWEIEDEEESDIFFGVFAVLSSKILASIEMGDDNVSE